MRNSFAHKYWKEFEKLSIDIIKDVYDGIPGVICRHTTYYADGGYDGFVSFPLNKYDSNMSDDYKVLLEAKLRTDTKQDLPLASFSKSIIIAINLIADRICISTNVHFSAETIAKLNEFSARTGLQIDTLDCFEIADWLNRNHEKAINEYSEEFIIELSKCADYVPSHNKSMLQVNYYNHQMDVIGESRIKKLKEYSRILSISNGVISIRGIIGSGKSVFIDSLISLIRNDFGQIKYINLSISMGIRDVFLIFLSMAWGVDPEVIVSMDISDLKSVTEYLGNEKFPLNSCKALIDMIKQPQTEFDENISLNSFLLLCYLKRIFTPTLKRIRYLIVIEEISKAPVSTLNFLLSIIKSMSTENICFVIEESIRPDSRYKSFMEETRKIKSFISNYDLPVWEIDDAIDYLKTILPEINTKSLEQLVRYIGTNPLALSASAILFKNTDLHNLLTIANFKIPHSFMQQKVSTNYLNQIVHIYMTNNSISFQCCAVLLGMLDGYVQIEKARSFLGLFDLEIDEGVFDCPFIKVDGERISVTNLAYLDSIRKYDYLSTSFLYEVLKKLLNRLSDFITDRECILRKQYQIIRIIKDYKLLRRIWKPLVSNSLVRGEIEFANEVLEMVYDYWRAEPIAIKLSHIDMYFLLINLVKTTLKLYGANSNRIESYLEQIDVLLGITETNDFYGISKTHALAKVYALRSDIALSRAIYSKMYDYSEQGISLLCSDNLKEDEKATLGDLWAKKAIAIKHIFNLDSCIEFFETGYERLSEVESFIFYYYTHLGSKYSVIEPRKSLDYFNEILKKCTSISLDNMLHTRHNIASMYFTLGEYIKAAQESSEVWTLAYENNVRIEEGRSDHLLGCVAWIQGNCIQAYKCFQDAYDCFCSITHYTHIWPPLVNLASLCFEMGKPTEGLENAKRASSILLNYHKNTINNLVLHPAALPKLYVAILILLNIFEKHSKDSSTKEAILEEITLMELKHDYEKYIVTDKLTNYLERSCYFYAGKILVKI